MNKVIITLLSLWKTGMCCFEDGRPQLTYSECDECYRGKISRLSNDNDELIIKNRELTQKNASLRKDFNTLMGFCFIGVMSLSVFYLAATKGACVTKIPGILGLGSAFYLTHYRSRVNIASEDGEY